MKIIDAHLHFVPENPYFQEIAVRAEHKNTEEDLRAVYQKYNIEGGVVMGNRGVDPVDHSYPEFLRYCVGIDRDFLVSEDKKKSLDQVEENLKRDTCVGIKLYPGYNKMYVTDEVYEHIIYAPAEHICMASLPGMFEHTITCNALSKTYSITGWRLGYLIGPAEVIEGARKVHDFLTVGAAAPLQEAAVAGLEMPASYYEELQALYTEKRDHFLAGLDRVGLKHNVPQGTYFVMIDISDFLALPQFKGWTDLQFCEWMIREVGVAAVPGSSFFREPVNHLIRFHFAKKDETLLNALNRLESLRAKIPSRKRN